MSYENLKKEITQAVQEHYHGGTPLNDIRAAIHAADLMAEQFGAIEMIEIIKSRANKTDA